MVDLNKNKHLLTLHFKGLLVTTIENVVDFIIIIVSSNMSKLLFFVTSNPYTCITHIMLSKQTQVIQRQTETRISFSHNLK